MKRPSLQNKRIGVLRMAFRAQKGFVTFQNRAPGLYSVRCKLISMNGVELSPRPSRSPSLTVRKRANKKGFECPLNSGPQWGKNSSPKTKHKRDSSPENLLIPRIAFDAGVRHKLTCKITSGFQKWIQELTQVVKSLSDYDILLAAGNLSEFAHAHFRSDTYGNNSDTFSLKWRWCRVESRVRFAFRLLTIGKYENKFLCKETSVSSE